MFLNSDDFAKSNVFPIVIFYKCQKDKPFPIRFRICYSTLKKINKDIEFIIVYSFECILERSAKMSLTFAVPRALLIRKLST